MAQPVLTDITRIEFDPQFSPGAYNAVNTITLTNAVVRVLRLFIARGQNGGLIRTLITNLTSDNTAVGYAAQIQGYDWLLREGGAILGKLPRF